MFSDKIFILVNQSSPSGTLPHLFKLWFRGQNGILFHNLDLHEGNYGRIGSRLART